MAEEKKTVPKNEANTVYVISGTHTAHGMRLIVALGRQDIRMTSGGVMQYRSLEVPDSMLTASERLLLCKIHKAIAERALTALGERVGGTEEKTTGA